VSFTPSKNRGNQDDNTDNQAIILRTTHRRVTTHRTFLFALLGISLIGLGVVLTKRADDRPLFAAAGGVDGMGVIVALWMSNPQQRS